MCFMVANQSQCFYTHAGTRGCASGAKHTHATAIQRFAAEMASQEQSDEKLAFSRWRFKHYFKFIVVKGKNVQILHRVERGYRIQFGNPPPTFNGVTPRWLLHQLW